MSLALRNCHKDLHIIVNNNVINQKSKIMLLGVTFDNQPSFSSHVSNVCRKANCQTGVLLRLRNLVWSSAKLHIVKFAILPQTIWHFCCSSDARKLEKFNNKHYALFTLTINWHIRNSCKEQKYLVHYLCDKCKSLQS